MNTSPPFGQADLTNCERELIHLAGSVQPHGLLLVLREPEFVALQASENIEAFLGLRPADLLGHGPAVLGADLPAQLRALADADLAEPVPLQCRLTAHGGPARFEGSVHRIDGGLLVVELEPVEPRAGLPVPVALPPQELSAQLGQAVERLSGAASIGTLADAVVKCVREMVGYDRVMVYKFDPDGHGKIIAEARDPRLDSLLGHHYPATDIPQRARELYLRNRVRMLVDVHYEASPLVPRQLPGAGELDMSMSTLRSMSPLHLQYLKNMGVTATLVVSLVRDGALWGLIACHHYAPRNLRLPVRSAVDLLAEVVSTRIAAIENYAYAQVAIQVRRLEQRLIEATSTEGDWRLALLRNPRTLLQPLDASGAALFHDGEVLSAGEAPSTPQLRALEQWIETQEHVDALFHCSSIEQANPALAGLTPTCSGVVAVRLSADRSDWMMWFRKEQLLSVTWAGDPAKPMVTDDPLELSPRRSFAAWSEIVRGTAAPWTLGELALARAIGASLSDIIVQVNAVRLLIAEHQLSQLRGTVRNAKGAVLVADGRQRTLFANQPCLALLGGLAAAPDSLEALAGLFESPAVLRQALAGTASDGHSWRGEAVLAGPARTPVAVRAEVVPARDGAMLGLIVMFEDLTEARRALQAREHLERSLHPPAPARGLRGGDRDPLLSAIYANASLAAMDIADGHAAPSAVPVLEEVEASTRRAAALCARIRGLGDA